MIQVSSGDYKSMYHEEDGAWWRQMGVNGGGGAYGGVSVYHRRTYCFRRILDWFLISG